VVAGGLLQGTGATIKAAPGEGYPDAVQRVVDALDKPERDALRADVKWVLEYEDHDPDAGR
jgi:hypothetical protein